METVLNRSVTCDVERENIFHFSLQHALPPGHSLVLNLMFGSLLHLECSDSSTMPRLVRQEQFTHTEMSILKPLLEFFPYYCPYEVLHASFYTDGQMNDERIANTRRYLEEAKEDGKWDREFRPVRCALSRTRLKLRTFGIDISSIMAIGYILVVQQDAEQFGSRGGYGS